MKTKLIEVGDKLFLKDVWLAQYNIPFEHRECEVVKYDGYIVVKNENWNKNENSLMLSGSVFDYFIISSSINHELLQLINSDIQFVSLSGTTIDGKTISISR